MRFGPIVRALLAIGVAIIGFAAAQRTAALVMHRGGRDAGNVIAEGDARIAAMRAERLAAAITDPSERAQAVAAARRSLLRDPTSPSAAITLALAAGVEGQASKAQHWADYSLRMSRRELRAHLWSIETAVAQGDVNKALRHYDMALRTSSSAPDLLFPVLSSALSEAPVRTGVERILAQGPGWKDLFLNWLSSYATDLRPATILFTDLARRGIPIPLNAKASLVGTLVGRGDVANAWRVYASYVPDADRRRSRQAAFDGIPAVVSPFDWNLTAGDGVSATIQQGARGAVLAFDAANGAGGIAAQQLQFLPPGRYMLSGSGADMDVGSQRPYWQLACIDGTELGRVPVLSTAAPFRGVITVPQTCPVQWLSLYVPLIDLTGRATGTIERTAIVPAQF